MSFEGSETKWLSFRPGGGNNRSSIFCFERAETVIKNAKSEKRGVLFKLVLAFQTKQVQMVLRSGKKEGNKENIRSFL